MQKSLIEDLFEKMNEQLFFVLVILVQVVFIFQGFNFTDSGSSAVFYQRILSDPGSVQYNFSYWLTGIIGGGWLKLFPGLGLLGLRIAGVICTTVTFGISYHLLKKYLQTAPLRLGLLLIILFLSTSVKELNSLDITALFFTCSAWFLHSGLTEQKYSRLFTAGMFIAANIFVRLPNILSLFLICAIWFSGYLNRIPYRQVAVQSLIFASGFLTMVAVLFLLMKGLHQDSFYLSNLETLRHSSGNQVNTRNLHDTFKPYLQQYALALIVSIVVIVALWSFASIWKRLKLEVPLLRGFWPVGKYLILALLTGMCIYHAWIDSNFWYWLFLFYLGTSLIVALLIIFGRQPKEMQLLSFIGSLILLILPLGSHALLMTIGKYGMWIMVPITVDYLLNVRSLSSTVVISENRRHTYDQVINTGQMDSLRNGFIFLTFAYVLSDCYFYPYGDLGNRIEMKYEINNVHVSRIYSTPEKAIAVDELLAVSKKYIRPNDYVLAYDGFPVFYFLTDTRPYLYNSWLWRYDGDIFKKELLKSINETHICPVVVIRKKRNRDSTHGRDSDLFREKTYGYMQTFFRQYGYRQIWENDFFRLFVPEIKQLPVAISGS